ncbi:hypothetical protein HZS_1393 [Henneguya salminicola]|nr:hypothetical protein HZS_1393 [Henneguya salminicola]
METVGKDKVKRTHGELFSFAATAFAAQDSTLAVPYVVKYIWRKESSGRCRRCKESNVTVSHILSNCPEMAGVEYKARQDEVVRAIYQEIGKTLALDGEQPLMVDQRNELIYDVKLVTAKVKRERRSDITLIDKEHNRA